MPQTSPSFERTVIQHYKPSSKSSPHFSDKAISQATINRWFKELEDQATDAPRKPLQRHMRLEVWDELVGITGQSPYCASKYLD